MNRTHLALAPIVLVLFFLPLSAAFAVEPKVSDANPQQQVPSLRERFHNLPPSESMRYTDDSKAHAGEDRKRIRKYPKGSFAVALAGDLFFYDDDADASIQVLLHYLDQEPTNQETVAIVHDTIGRMLLSRGKIRLARHEFEEAASQNPSLSPHIWACDMTIWLSDIARSYEEEGRLLDALREYQVAAHMAKEDDLDHEFIAGVLDKMGAYREAINEYQAALDWSAPSKKIAVLTPQGRIDKAPGNEKRCELHVELGKVLWESGQTQAAQRQFERCASEEDPDSLYSLQRLFDFEGDATAARAVYKMELQGSSSLAESHSIIAGAAESYNDLDFAILEARRALKINPGDPRYHQLLGEILSKTADHDSAIAEIKKGMTIAEHMKPRRMPGFKKGILRPASTIPIHHSLGLLLEKWGRYREANEELQLAHELAPKNITYRNDYDNLQEMLSRNNNASTSDARESLATSSIQ